MLSIVQMICVMLQEKKGAVLRYTDILMCRMFHIARCTCYESGKYFTTKTTSGRPTYGIVTIGSNGEARADTYSL